MFIQIQPAVWSQWTAGSADDQAQHAVTPAAHPVLIGVGKQVINAIHPSRVHPLIAIHLYVFYYGLMADVTPPVGLASYAAAAISRADPIKTGIQAFWYSLRTGILPIVFIFNNELLLMVLKTGSMVLLS